MTSRRFEARVDESDAVRIDTFIRTWNGGSKRSTSDAIRALIRLGLDAAARPSTFDERWLDLNERLARMELLLDSLGRCVAANPALAAWMLAQGNERGEAARERLAQSIEVLIQADWDERCRVRGIPRPRHVPRSRRQPIGTPIGTRTRRDLYRMTLRLPTTYRERVHALAIRMDQPPLVALRRLVEIGIHVTEAETWHDEIDKLLDSARRIEVQLDEIGALATGTGLVTVHLWRRHKGLTDEWEQAVVNEVTEVAEGAWMNMLAGPPPPAPPSLLGDEDDDETSVEGA